MEWKRVQIAKNTPRLKASAKKPLTISRLRCSMGKIMTVSIMTICTHYDDEFTKPWRFSFSSREILASTRRTSVLFFLKILWNCDLWPRALQIIFEKQIQTQIYCTVFCAFKKNTGLFLGNKTGGIKSINCCWKPRKCYLHCLDFSYVKVSLKFSKKFFKNSFFFLDTKKFNTKNL